MIGFHEQIPIDIKLQANNAGCLSRTFNKRPEAQQDFIHAFCQTIENAQRNKPLTAELYGRYSQTAMKYTNQASDWKERFTSKDRINIADETIREFYERVKKRGELTIESLAELYYKLNINELLVDGNTRALILALCHVLIQHKYSPPDFNQSSLKRLYELQFQYPNDHRKAVIEFLREVLGAIPLY